MLVRAHCSIISVKSQGLCRFYEAGTDLGCLDRAGGWGLLLQLYYLRQQKQAIDSTVCTVASVNK